MNISIEAEQALLGALLLDNGTLEFVGETLKSEHFCHRLHGKLFEKIKNKIHEGNCINSVIAKELIKNDPLWHEQNDDDYLINLTSSVFTNQTIDHYARIIYNNFLKRQLVSFHQKSLHRLKTLEEEKTLDYIEILDKELCSLTNTFQNNRSSLPLHDSLLTSIEKVTDKFLKKRKVWGVTSGFKVLDDLLGGLMSPDLIILAGRPSMGKTALATTIALNTAKICLQGEKEGAPVAFFSLEMSGEQLASRVLSTESNIPSEQIRKGEIQEKDIQKLEDLSKSLQNLPFFVDDISSMTVSSLRSKARKLKKDHNIGLIIVDYLQLLEADKSTGNRVQEVSEISRQLKGIAKELNVPILALSQLSRAVEQRDNKRPQLSDLRDSGSIEQDADIVIFVYRDDYYNQKSEGSLLEDSTKKKGINMIPKKTEIIVAKHRHGPTGTAHLLFNSALTCFKNP